MPPPVTFPAQQVGTQSPTVTLTVTNIGGGPITVSSVDASNLAEFPETQNCVGSIAAGASCQIAIAFVPTAVGVRSQTITIFSDGPESPQSFAVSGTGSTEATLVDLNQHGLTGSWYEPATNGQGIEVEVFPDLVSRGTGRVQVSWFTFDTNTMGGAERQRWYTMGGNVSTGAASVTLPIYQNVGGNFNAAPITNSIQVGTATLRFADCDHGTLDYKFTDGSGRSDRIDLTRLTKNVTCVTTGERPVSADFAYSGNWYDPATSGQGLTVEINPLSPVAFFAWYTYAPGGAAAGPSGQRWYTGKSDYAAGARTLAMTLYETTGGLFDAPVPTPMTLVVGAATLTFQSCIAATLDYAFTGGNNAGAAGQIALTKIGPTRPGC
jgi:pseudomonalisin